MSLKKLRKLVHKSTKESQKQDSVQTTSGLEMIEEVNLSSMRPRIPSAGGGSSSYIATSAGPQSSQVGASRSRFSECGEAAMKKQQEQKLPAYVA